jgi:phage terminase large subunit GpA-like protein
VRHLCPHCGALITQGQYLGVADRGFYLSEDGALTLDAAGIFRDQAGADVPPPRHIAFVDVWTAYSPAASWPSIVRDFIAAHEKSQAGDQSKLKAFWNTTLGRAWEADVEKTDANELQARAEGFPLRMVPPGGLLLLSGVDTQDNRLEAVVWAFGRGSEMWTVDHRVFFGNPAEDHVWAELEEFLFVGEYQHVSGHRMKIDASAIDTGGHHTNAVYEFARKHARRNVYAVRGVPGRERSIKHGAGPVDIDWRGQRRKRGVVLWHVGTNLAKDLFYSRLQVARQGPGYVHFSSELSDEFFRQLAGEARAERVGASGRESRWTALRKRVEALDGTVYALWLEAHLELQRKSAAWWDRLAERIAPRQASLLDGGVLVDEPAPRPATPSRPPVTPDSAARTAARRSHVASDDWSSRL